MKGQKSNSGARKLNLFTTLVELRLYDSQNLCSKKDLFFKHIYVQPPISHGGFIIELVHERENPKDVDETYHGEYGINDTDLYKATNGEIHEL